MIVIKDKMGRILSGKELKYKGMGRIKAILKDLHLMILRFAGHIPSHGIRLLFYKLSRIEIGGESKIHMWCNFFDPCGVKIGKDTIIGDHAFLDGRGKIAIGNHVDIASSVMIYTSQHDVHSDDFGAICRKVIIEDYVFVGPRVIILPGVKIGRGAVVAAGAVVTKDISSFSIAGGVPAVVIGERRNKDPKYKLGRARLFQ